MSKPSELAINYPIIHLNGFPGVGKLTIARHVAEQLPPTKLVHNHLLINPADAILHRTQPGYQNLRKGIRGAIFTALATEAATFATSYIFTDFQSSDDIGSSVCEEYLVLAQNRNAALIPIVLSCSWEVNMKRLVSPDRQQHHKLTDVELVGRFRREEDVFRFDKHPNYLHIDVSQLPPQESARLICEHVLRVCPMMETKSCEQIAL